MFRDRIVEYSRSSTGVRLGLRLREIDLCRTRVMRNNLIVYFIILYHLTIAIIDLVNVVCNMRNKCLYIHKTKSFGLLCTHLHRIVIRSVERRHYLLHNNIKLIGLFGIVVRLCLFCNQSVRTNHRSREDIIAIDRSVRFVRTNDLIRYTAGTICHSIRDFRLNYCIQIDLPLIACVIQSRYMYFHLFAVFHHNATIRTAHRYRHREHLLCVHIAILRSKRYRVIMTSFTICYISAIRPTKRTLNFRILNTTQRHGRLTSAKQAISKAILVLNRCYTRILRNIRNGFVYRNIGNRIRCALVFITFFLSNSQIKSTAL